MTDADPKIIKIPIENYDDMRAAMENPTIARIAEHLSRLKETSFRFELDWDETMNRLDGEISKLPVVNIYEVINKLIAEIEAEHA